MVVGPMVRLAQDSIQPESPVIMQRRAARAAPVEALMLLVAQVEAP